MMSDTAFIPMLLLLWCRAAPLRFIASWILSKSKMPSPSKATPIRANSIKEYPAACDLTNPQYSPVTVARQFYSSCLRANSNWMQVLNLYAEARGLDSRSFTKDVARRQLAQADAQVHRRHSYRFSRPPLYPFPQIADDRRSNSERARIAHHWYHKSKECCDDEGFNRRIRKMICDVAAFIAGASRIPPGRTGRQRV